MSRQQPTIKLGLYYFNGSYRAIPNTLDDYPIWNHRFSADLEFRSSAVSRALSGFERSNVSGYRIEFNTDLRNMYREDSEKLRLLFSLCASQFNRVIQTLPITVNSPTQVTLGAGASNSNGFYDGTYIMQGTLKTRIVTYNGATKIATVQGDTLTSGNRDIALLPDKATIMGVSPSNNVADIIYCNLNSSAISLNRELTVGSQVVSLSLRSVERFPQIPQSLVL